MGNILIKSVSVSQNGIKVQGVVTENRAVTGDDSTTYMPIITFKTLDTKKIVTDGSPGSSNPPMFKVGEEVEVAYNKDNPKDAIINTFMNVYGLNSIIMLFGAIFIIIGLVLLISSIKKRKHRDYGSYTTYSNQDFILYDSSYNSVKNESMKFKAILWIFLLVFGSVTTFLGYLIFPMVKEIPKVGVISAFRSDLILILIFPLFFIGTLLIMYQAIFARNKDVMLTLDEVKSGAPRNGKVNLYILFTDEDNKKYSFTDIVFESEENKYVVGTQYYAQCMGKSVIKLLNI